MLARPDRDGSRSAAIHDIVVRHRSATPPVGAHALPVAHADACELAAVRSRSSDNACSSRPADCSATRSPNLVRCPRSFRRDVRDAALLREPHLRAGRRRRRARAASFRRLGNPLHPRRDLQGQRSASGQNRWVRQWRLAVRAVDVSSSAVTGGSRRSSRARSRRDELEDAHSAFLTLGLSRRIDPVGPSRVRRTCKG